jgi:hypothetical protein
MNNWARLLYGDPCSECGFGWAIAPSDATAYIGSVADRYQALLRGFDGTQRHPELSWSAGAYVCHVSDNLRIWAERLAAAAAGARGPIAPYDSDLLARARRYEDVAVEGALWSLRRAAHDWLSAVELSRDAEAILVHPERGALSVDDIVVSNGHDCAHHAWDIARSLPQLPDR